MIDIWLVVTAGIKSPHCSLAAGTGRAPSNIVRHYCLHTPRHLYLLVRQQLGVLLVPPHLFNDVQSINDLLVRQLSNDGVPGRVPAVLPEVVVMVIIKLTVSRSV